MLQDVVLEIKHRTLATDKQQRITVVHHAYLVRRHQLTPGDLVVGAVIAAAPAGLTVGVGVNRGFSKVGF